MALQTNGKKVIKVIGGNGLNDLFEQPRVVPSSPKLMNLREVGVDYAMEKNMDWHSRLPVTSHSNMIRNAHKVFYGAEYQDHCFAVAMWTDPVAGNRMSKDHVWLELRRLAISPDAPKFTATWMISQMVKDIKKRFPDVTKLVSYQDTEVHTGTIYKAANWVLDSVSKFQEWSSEKRQRNALQTKADKIRWIYEL
jgi:hypothetical protein